MLKYICIIPILGTEQEAYVYETFLISTIGIRSDSSGPLTNICKIGGGGPVLVGVNNPNTNIIGDINITNQKKSITLKKTWLEGRFIRDKHLHSDEAKESISRHKREFWTEGNHKQEHSEKWKKIWSDPEYKKNRLAKINHMWRVITPLGEFIDIPNLTQFCKTHNILYEVCRIKFKNGKSYKGYMPIVSD